MVWSWALRSSETRRHGVVSALNYANTKIFCECINQVRRMEAANDFDPMHVQGHGVDEADVDHLISSYRLFGLPRFSGLPAKTKEELPAYRAAVAMMKPLEERGGKVSGVNCARGPLCYAPCCAMCLARAPRSARSVS